MNSLLDFHPTAHLHHHYKSRKFDARDFTKSCMTLALAVLSILLAIAIKFS